MIAVANRTDTRWCSRQNDVAWSECQRSTGKSDKFRHGIDHLTGVRALFHLAVLVQLDFQITNIDIGIHERPEWRVSIERFAPAKLLFRRLQIAIADVETDAVAKNKVTCLLRVYIFRRFADHYGQLDLEVGLMFRISDFDLPVVRQKRAWRLEPDQRCAERRSCHLFNMIDVIEPDRDQLRRRHRKIDIHIREHVHFARRFDVDPIWTRQHVDFIGDDFAVEKFVV